MSTNSTPKPDQSGLLRGRFSEATDAFVEAFTASVNFDQRLYAQDIAGSVAHAQMLASIGVLSQAEADDIVNALQPVDRSDRRYR